MKFQFTKMHSLGNDFVVIDDRSSKLTNLPRLAEALCHRRFGIGADQLLLLCHSKTADFKMRIFNADGSEVEMCGNGIRCLGKYIWDKLSNTEKLRVKKFLNSLSIETMAGIMYLKKSGKLIRVDMGEPVLEPEKIPVKIRAEGGSRKAERKPGNQYPGSGIIIDYPVNIKDKTLKLTCVSMGNPHAVVVVKNVDSFPVGQFGPVIENHTLFPKRTNVEFIQITDAKNIEMRVWERGAGETMACGTGASASAVASVLLGHTDRKVTVHLPGGKLLIEWSEKDNHVYMTGDAVKVFAGEIEIAI